MKMVPENINFYFVIIIVSSILQFPSISVAENLNNVLVCADLSRVMEISQVCIGDSESDTNNVNNIGIAIESLNNIIDECPQDEHLIRISRADCFKKVNKLPEALSDYQYFLSSNASTPFSDIRNAIGLIYYKQGKYKEAIQEFTIAINKEINSYRDYLYRARAYRESGDSVAAFLDYKESLKQLNEIDGVPQPICESCYSPFEVDIYLEMGSWFEQQGEFNKAINLYNEGLKNNPGSLELKNKIPKTR